MKFSEKLRQVRDRAGLSEATLAEKSGITFASVHQYGLGRRSPSFSAVVKLARALGVTCQEFADCEDIADEVAKEKPAVRKPAGKKGKP